MGVYEIVFGVVLILACLLIVVFTLAQEQKGHGPVLRHHGRQQLYGRRP